MSDIDHVKNFIAAWNARDLDAIGRALHPDINYHNIPMAAIQGRGQVIAAIEPLVKVCTEVNWRIHHIAATGYGVVLTERIDDFVKNGKRISVRVMGTFELRDGLIFAWRDYFDLAEFQSQL